MKRKLKSLLISLMFLIFFVLFSSNLLGNSFVNAEFNFATQVTADWTKQAKGEGLAKSTGNIVGTIINIIRIVGTGVAIIMITYVAIKYMSAAPNEKAEFKKSATAYIVGAVVLFASSNLLGVISDFATANIGSK